MSKNKESLKKSTPPPEHISQVIWNVEIFITPDGTYLLGKDGSIIDVSSTAVTVGMTEENISLEELLEDHKTLENQKGE